MANQKERIKIKEEKMVVEKVSAPKKFNFDKVLDGLTKFGGVIGQQKHLSAIRDAFATFLPFILVASFALLINSVFISNTGLIASEVGKSDSKTWVEFSKYVSPFFVYIVTGTLDLIGVYSTFLVGFFLSRSYGNNGLFGGLISLAGFFLLQPISAGNAPGFNNPMAFLGARGLILGFFSSLVVCTIYTKIKDVSWLKVKMPKGVPPAVANGFSALFPIAISLAAFGVIQPIWQAIVQNTNLAIKDLPPGTSGVASSPYFYLFGAIEKGFAAPFANASSNLGFIFALSFMVCFFWFFGLHGSMILAPIFAITWEANGYYNASMFNEYGMQVFEEGFLVSIGEQPLHNWTKGAYDYFTLFGGSGATMGLILVQQFIGKRNTATHKITRVAAIPGIFNINEPIIFGVPLMLNFLYVIPFMLIQPLMAVSVGAMINSGMVRPGVVAVPWTTPFFISGYLSTLDPMSFLVSTISFGIMIVGWLPFVIIAGKVNKNNSSHTSKSTHVITAGSYNKFTSIGWLEDIYLVVTGNKDKYKKLREANEAKDKKDDKGSGSEGSTNSKDNTKNKKDSSKPKIKPELENNPNAVIDLDSMTVTQLRGVANLKGMTLPKDAKKADMVKALKERLKIK